MISAKQALENLRAGNLRFASGDRIRGSHTRQEFFDELIAQQSPFAVVLGCSDSRVPAEIIFDQGLGDLFVVRVAGNIVAPSQIGSIEFAVQQFGSRLVVVLGHSRCGAVEATVEELQQGRGNQSDHLNSIIDRIRPAVESVLSAGCAQSHGDLLVQAVRANINASVNQLRSGSDLIKHLVRTDGLMIVGAEYSLETRLVAFFDGVAESA